jgi:hypothetical protein
MNPVRTWIIVVIFAFSPFFATGDALSKSPRELKWDDLAPPIDDIRARFSHLTQDQLSTLYELYGLQKWVNDSDSDVAASKNKSVQTQIDDYTAKLTSQNLDVPELMDKIAKAMDDYNRLRAQPIKSLDGQFVRLPGYVLPLEFGGDAVSEFFLVPYVGACIHTPAPDANQIVLVKLQQSYKPSGLFDAVWVTGQMKIVASKHKLGYRDGTGDVASTYQLDGVRIVPYVAE